MDDKFKNELDSATRKYLERTFDLIISFETKKDFKIISNYPTIDGLNLCLVKGDRCFNFETGFINAVKEPVKYQGEGYGYFKPFDLVNEELRLQVPLGVLRMDMKPDAGKSNGEITEINSGVNLGQKLYSRALIPIEYNPNKTPLNYLESAKFKVADSLRVLGLITVEINSNKFHFFDYNFNKQYYFIIDSLNPTEQEEFENYINSILYSYALISGYLPRNEVYFFYSPSTRFDRDLSFVYRRIQDTVDSGMEIICPRDLQDIERSRGNNISRLKLSIQASVFSRLCTLAHTDPRILRTLRIITESNIYPLEIRAATYLVALETMKNIIIEENEDKVNPIKSKAVNKQLIKDIKSLLDQLDNSVFNNKKAVITRVEQINQITNTDSIFKAFELVGMNLNDDDKDCLAKRNDFLHGRLPFESEILFKHSKELQHITYKIHFLLTSLILKYSGYSGFVKNNPKYFDVFVAKTQIKEPLFRKI